ncbi:polyketide synthase [Fusarium pseudocircinatum]|uniref:Polyketide synthase n=1 Tax=Fusarium pseudocircinatum TaxID=56676 RepID=A0A8H5L4T0_9HYPO|nr:polyketide synthase [Fusarium pseudocircinatum]
MKRTLEFFRQGKLGPLRPVTSFAASDVRKAFRFLQDGQHTGKVVLEMPTDPSDLDARVTNQRIRFDPHASYFLVGGLGGLGKALAVWLVERGARHLVFLSRSGMGMAESRFSEELRAMGCSLVAIKGSVNRPEDLDDAISKAPCPSEVFFTLPWCKGHFLGLPASVLSICGVEDIGYLAENPSALRSTKLQGIHVVREKEFLESVEASLFTSIPRDRGPTSHRFENLLSSELSPWNNNGHIIMGLRSHLHLDDPRNPTNWRRDRRMGTYHNLPTGDQADTRGESNRLKVFLQSISEGDANEILAREESIDFLSVEISVKVNDFLLRPDAPVDPNLKLSEMGLDSLTAIELRRWFGQVFGLQVSVLEMIGAPSLKEVGRIVATRFGEKLDRQGQGV